MEYLKEFQAFAGRFSAAAEDKLASVDGGTYNEFIRLYSRGWSTQAGNNDADDEQRQMEILLQELQFAMASPSLLTSVPPGTVLHTGAVETGVAAAVDQLCVTLEKCIFFGAEGFAPDFWQLVWSAGVGGIDDVCEDEDSSSGAVENRPKLEGLATESTRRRPDSMTSVPCEAASPDTTRGNSETTQVIVSSTTKDAAGAPESLAINVSRLTQVHTGHGRCRAWARGLLGLDGASAGRELRGTLEAAAAAGDPLGTETAGVKGKKNHNSEAILPMENQDEGELEHPGGDKDGGDDGPSGNVGEFSLTLHTVPVVGEDVGLVPVASNAWAHLPLWLRPGPRGGAFLDDLCRSLAGFQDRLIANGLSLRPSLDHAWLDKENIAAETTYTWPGFRREKLRCRVHGAGISAANGEYSPVKMEESDGTSGNVKGDLRGLLLVGPGGCQIKCHHIHLTLPSLKLSTDRVREKLAPSETIDATPFRVKPAPVSSANDDGADISKEAVIVEEDTAPLPAVATNSAPSMTAKEAATASTPSLAQLWYLLVPLKEASEGLRTRNTYCCIGNGVLPPSRGWRAMDASDVPAPVFEFSTQDDGALDVEGGRREEDLTQKVGDQDDRPEAPFCEAVLVTLDGFTTTRAEGSGGLVRSSIPTGERDASAEPIDDGPIRRRLSSGASQSARRRKRRRPPDIPTLSSTLEGALTGAHSAEVSKRQTDEVVANTYVSSEEVNSIASSGTVSSGDLRAPSEALDAGPRRVHEESRKHRIDGDKASGTFKSESWELPPLSGEVLQRAKRTGEQLEQIAQSQALTLASQKDQLQKDVDRSKQEHQEVLRESMSDTVDRILAARAHLRECADAEARVGSAAESQEQLTTVSDESRAMKERSEPDAPSLEELVAAKMEELRTRPRGPSPQSPPTRGSDGTPSSSSSPSHPTRKEPDSLTTYHSEVTGTTTPAADLGWPWPAEWLSAPRGPPPREEREGVEAGADGDVVDFGVVVWEGYGDARLDDGDGRGDDRGNEHGDIDAHAAPYSIEVVAVEVVEEEEGDADAVHIEYVLRVRYRERRQARSTSADSALPPSSGRRRSGRKATVTTAQDSGATELARLATAATGLLQRSRVLSKRLNSLCALHPQLMWQLEEGRGQEPDNEKGEKGMVVEPLAFPDPFELGTLEETILRIHGDKLTPRFKAHPPIRKLTEQIGSYLSGLLGVLSTLQKAGQTDAYTNASRALNDALLTCDRAGRKRVSSDFVLSVRTVDIAGGRLGSGSGDDERLRLQKRRCMGCGRAIAAEFLGIKRDFFPCRFANGLFCRSYCHIEDRRVIPHRVLHHWDFTHHRVCRDAVAFLDATHHIPMMNLQKESPQLFKEQQSLRLVRLRRNQLHFLRRMIIFPERRKCVSGSRLLEKHLHGRMHLAVNPRLYSLEDFVSIKKGKLLDMLEEVVQALVAHVTDQCEVCASRPQSVCCICCKGSPVFAFQIGTTVARCPRCESLFHVKCATGKGQSKADGGGAGSSGLKWWADQVDIGEKFACLQCKAVSPMADAMDVQ